jgi:hypothetical protein
MLKPAGLKIYMMSHITFFVMLAFCGLLSPTQAERSAVAGLSTSAHLFSRVLTTNLIATSFAALLLFACVTSLFEAGGVWHGHNSHAA